MTPLLLVLGLALLLLVLARLRVVRSRTAVRSAPQHVHVRNVTRVMGGRVRIISEGNARADFRFAAHLAPDSRPASFANMNEDFERSRVAQGAQSDGVPSQQRTLLKDFAQ